MPLPASLIQHGGSGGLTEEIALDLVPGIGRHADDGSLLGRFMTRTTEPYAIPVKSWSACSMSSLGPSLLDQRPLSNCRAACFGTPARANNATFSYPDSS